MTVNNLMINGVVVKSTTIPEGILVSVNIPDQRYPFDIELTVPTGDRMPNFSEGDKLMISGYLACRDGKVCIRSYKTMKVNEF